VKKRNWRKPIRAIVFFPLFFSVGICATQSPSSGSGISEKTAADTVRIQNSDRAGDVERIRVKNSRANNTPDTAVLQSSDEPVIDRHQARNSDFMNQTPLIRSSTERVKSKGKIIAGAALFGASYGIAVFLATSIVTTGSNSSETNSMATCFYVPVVGPVLAEIASSPPSEIMAPITVLCLGWSAAQGIGLTLLITGLVGTPARNDLSSLPISIEPLVMKDRLGLTVRMRFN
jgi:hypothetical protein